MGLSVAKFSEKINIPAATIVCYERGERTPSATLFMQLHKNLNVNLNWFVSGLGKMYNEDSFRQDRENLVLEIKKVLKEEGIIK